MLRSLYLKHVGPTEKIDINFSKRLNFITGDNGLGKTFLLDIAWWALTRTWARTPVVPHRGANIQPSIKYSYTTSVGKPHTFESKFDRKEQIWPGRVGRPPIPGMVIYAQVDGGFSVWDPARNYWKKPSEGILKPPSFIFARKEVWNGLAGEDSKKLCNGLIHDWAAWQRDSGEAFDQLTKVLKKLSPSETEQLIPGPLNRVFLDDVRDHPTLKMPYQYDVALIHASAGMQRIVALAYLLVWTWQEHIRATEILGGQAVKEIVFIIDELEAHLHPQWQRRIVPALLDVMTALTGDHDVKVQLIAATHSPMVLVSTESIFDTDQDAIWDLDLVDKKVELTQAPWRRYGDANAWLTSSVFDLKEPRSLEAERAITEALKLLKSETPPHEEVERVDTLLKGALSDIDRFWLRWSQYRKDLEEKA